MQYNVSSTRSISIRGERFFLAYNVSSLKEWRIIMKRGIFLVPALILALVLLTALTATAFNVVPDQEEIEAQMMDTEAFAIAEEAARHATLTAMYGAPTEGIRAKMAADILNNYEFRIIKLNMVDAHAPTYAETVLTNGDSGQEGFIGTINMETNIWPAANDANYMVKMADMDIYREGAESWVSPVRVRSAALVANLNQFNLKVARGPTTDIIRV